MTLEKAPMGEEDEEKIGNEKTEKSTGGIRGVLITAVFTFLGVIFGVLGRGYFDLAKDAQSAATELKLEEEKRTAEAQLEEQKHVAEVQLEEEKHNAEVQLERQKFDADLVKLAIQGPDQQGRIDFLRFMVDTNLIMDAQIRKGVASYLPSVPENAQRVVPRYQPSQPSATPSLDARLQNYIASLRAQALVSPRIDFDSVTGFTRAEVDELVENLRAIGFVFRNATPDISPGTAKQTLVKYYAQSDEIGAQAIIESLKSSGVPNVQSTMKSPPQGYRQGHFDVELGSYHSD